MRLGGRGACARMSADSIFKQRRWPTQLRDLAALFARGLLEILLTLLSEGAGRAGCPMHPQPRVVCGGSHAR